MLNRTFKLDMPLTMFLVFAELGNFTEEIEHGIADGTYVDYVQKGNQFACTRLSTVKEVMEGVRVCSMHCFIKM